MLRKVAQGTKDITDGVLSHAWEGPYRITRVARLGTYYLENLEGKQLKHLWNVEHLKKYYP